MVQNPTKTNTATPTLPLPELVAMLEAGVHFGHERSKKNPKMETFVFQQRNRVAIIDLEQTQQALRKALAYVHQLASVPTKEILFVGTKRQAREIVRRHAESAHMPFVTKRWLGGTLTNFSTILKSIEKLEELKSVEGTPAAEKMTKKELSVMRKEINRLEAVLEGIRSMRTLPQAIFVIGSHDEKLAVLEAKRVGIPVIGICDTNADPDLVDYSIPANDDAVRALDLVVGAVAATIIQARSAATSPAAKTPAA